MYRKHIVSVDELKSRLGSASQNDNMVVLDCRFDLADPGAGKSSYKRAHIPAAVYADLDGDLAAPITSISGRHPLPPVASMAETFGSFGIDDSVSVVVYDDSIGAMAARAWWLLRWLGHNDVQLLDGGFAAWTAAGYQTCAGIESAETKTFNARPHDDRVLTTEQLLPAPNSVRSANLVDARDAARFRGEVEPIDSVAGHIPGARNLPLTESIDGDGAWKSVSELKALWRNVLGTDTEVRWAVMCGSGVTACHIALSGLEAGYSEPRVYVGSWSEWIRDSQRPIATGPD